MIRQIFRRFSTISYATSKQIQVPSDLFYRTVIDVADYKSFVPLTEQSTITSKINENEFYGKLTVNFKVYQGSFLSHVKHNADNAKGLYQVTSISKDNSMLKSLESRWTIKAVDENTCHVGYAVDYEFSSWLYQQTASIFMDTVAKGTLTAFEKRAIEVKGRTEKPQEIVSPTENITDDLEKHSEESYKNREPGLIAKMHKPRKINATVPRYRKVEESSISDKLALLKNEGKLDNVSFKKLNDSIYTDAIMKSSIINLYMLQRDGMLTDVHLIRYLKDLLGERYCDCFS